MKLKMYLIGLGMGVIVTAIIMGIALSGKTREMTDEEILARARQLGMVESSRLTEVTGNGQNAYLLSQNQTADTSAAGNTISQTQGENNPSSLVISGEDVPETETQDGAGEDGANDTQDPAQTPAADTGTVAGASADASAQTGAGQGNQGAQGTQAVAGVQNSSAEARAASSQQSAGGGASSSAQAASSTEQPRGGQATAQAASSTEQQVTGSIVVTIPDAANSEDICALLETAGVIDNATAFNNYLIQNGRDRYISTGAKLIPRGSSYEDVSRILTGR